MGFAPTRSFMIDVADFHPSVDHVKALGWRGRLHGVDLLWRALVHESELARNEPDSQVHHLPRAYDDGLPSSAIRLRM